MADGPGGRTLPSGGDMPDDGIAADAAARGLTVLGEASADGATVVLLGPDPARFWDILRRSPEWNDPDPVDAWSRRQVAALAAAWGGTPRFPFGEPPEPFMRWALGSGRCHSSPVGMLVHDAQGLMVSFRGAVERPLPSDGPVPTPSPCASCDAQPCRTACPVGALTAGGYDVPACRAYVASEAGRDCRMRGCRVRRACPVSPPRPDAQSAHHMEAFLCE
ncbi:ferredoxin [Jannaschia sp. LMIT008]|uniref:ferredoxin n=1 Tax=Jannaschia maritima TaxID=3032585 RepID=UPI0028113586|nr:ferredoxin [Jannaschia sp. LMIT008]